MSLHDQLLADLADLDDDDDGLEAIEEGGGLEDEADDVDEDAQMDIGVEGLVQGHITTFAKLRDSEQLKTVIEQIDKFMEQKTRGAVLGPIEEDPEYQLIVQANNLTVEIDNEIAVIHKYARDIYAKRFPELDQLVPDPLDYMLTVKLLRNEPKDKVDLTSVLAQATIMVVTVTASTTQGLPLEAEEMQQVLDACEMASDLMAAKERILEYVESRMYFLAPNLTHICGAPTAAKLMGVAGGLTALSKMPSCNILVLGSQKKSLSGFSAASVIPHTGFIYYSALVQGQPMDVRKKAAKLVANKVALASRVDALSGGVSGATLGLSLRQDIEKKIDKLLEPPPAKAAKALPRPDEFHSKKRGGRRQRNIKARREMSAAAKAANRITFAEIGEDVFQDEMGETLGQLAKGSGRFRAPETKQKNGTISKRMQRKLAMDQARSGGLSTIKRPTSGTASVAFTPVQGLEINLTNDADKRVKQANEKYFGGTKSFLNVKKRKATDLGV